MSGKEEIPEGWRGAEEERFKLQPEVCGGLGAMVSKVGDEYRGERGKQK